MINNQVAIVLQDHFHSSRIHELVGKRFPKWLGFFFINDKVAVILHNSIVETVFADKLLASHKLLAFFHDVEIICGLWLASAAIIRFVHIT